MAHALRTRLFNLSRSQWILWNKIESVPINQKFPSHLSGCCVRDFPHSSKELQRRKSTWTRRHQGKGLKDSIDEIQQIEPESNLM